MLLFISIANNMAYFYANIVRPKNFYFKLKNSINHEGHKGHEGIQ